MLLAACSSSVFAAPQVSTLGKSERPATLQPAGQPPIKVVAGYRWQDQAGEHWLYLAAGEGRARAADEEGGPYASRIVYAEQWQSDGQGGKLREWQLNDGVKDCDVDVVAEFELRGVVVRDLDGDGVLETALPYRMTCTSDVSPHELKLIIRQGARKYGLRGFDGYGVSSGPGSELLPLPKDCSPAGQVQYRRLLAKSEGWAFLADPEFPVPGCYTSEADFAAAPAGVLDFARQHWFKLLRLPLPQ